MSIFTNMAVGAIMKTPHPTIDRRSCWNLRPHKDKCDACMKICPKNLFERAGIVKDFAGCIDCNLCVSVCPTNSIIPSAERIEHDLKPLGLDKKTVWIGCERSARRNDVVETCVGALEWDTVSYLALNKKLVLDLTPCADCDATDCVEHLRKMLARTADFLGGEMFEARITLAEQQDDAPYEAREYTRREMMEHMTAGTRASTHQLLKMVPGLTEENHDCKNDQRLLLHQRMKQIKAATDHTVTYGFNLPTVADNCYACGRCERSCRSDAIKVVDGEDGYSRIVITPWKCSECGQCVTSCVEKAISPLTLRAVTTLGPVSVHKVKKVLCSECGKPMKPDSKDGICNVCAARIRMKKRQEEMKKKAEERKAKQAAEEAEKQAAAALAEKQTPDAAPAEKEISAQADATAKA